MQLTDRQKDLIKISILSRLQKINELNDKYKLDNYTAVAEEYKEILKKLKDSKWNLI